MRRLLVVAVAALSLAACSSAGSGGDGHDGGVSGTTSAPGSSPASSPPPVDQSVTAQDLGAKVCPGNYYPSETLELFAASEGFCEMGGDVVGVYTFASRDARDQWVSAARAVSGNIETGESLGAVWAFSGDNGRLVRGLAANLR